GELINFAWKNFDVQGRSEPVSEFVAIADQGHAETEAGKRAKDSDDRPLPEKNPDDLGDVRAERFHDSDLAPFLDRDGDECAHDSERRDDDNEEKQKEHHVTLEPDRFEELMIHLGPGLREHRRLDELLD